MSRTITYFNVSSAPGAATPGLREALAAARNAALVGAGWEESSLPSPGTLDFADLPRWWDNLLEFQVRAARNGPEGTIWFPVRYHPHGGAWADLQVRIAGEVHLGGIDPKSAEDAAALQAARSAGGPKSGRTRQIKARGDKKACILIQKWSCGVKTNEDGSLQEVPDDKFLSDYYAFVELLSEAYSAEMGRLVANGEAFTAAVREIKAVRPGKPRHAAADAGAAGVLAAVEEAHPGVTHELILSSEDAAAIRTAMKNPAEGAAILRGIPVAPSVKVVSLVQTTAEKGTQPLSCGGLTRIGIKFPTAKSKAETLLSDMSKPYRNDKGAISFEKATVDGAPVTDYTVHRFVTPSGKCYGTINMGSGCFSNMGISIPTSLSVLAYHPASGAAKASVDDALEGVDLSAFAELAVAPGGGGGGGGAGAATGGAATTLPAKSGDAADDDAFADVVGDGDLGY
jgi:hypothetical protein